MGSLEVLVILKYWLEMWFQVVKDDIIYLNVYILALHSFRKYSILHKVSQSEDNQTRHAFLSFTTFLAFIMKKHSDTEI